MHCQTPKLHFRGGGVYAHRTSLVERDCLLDLDTSLAIATLATAQLWQEVPALQSSPICIHREEEVPPPLCHRNALQNKRVSIQKKTTPRSLDSLRWPDSRE